MSYRTISMATFLYILSFIIGITLAYFGMKQYLLTSRILSDGIVTSSTVVDFATIYDGHGDTYAPVYEYRNRSGINTRYESKVSYAKPTIQIGDILEIVYNPTDENVIKVVSFWGLYLWPIIFFSFAPPFLLIGGGYLLYTYA